MSSSKGLMGLAISYALSVTDRLSGMVTSFTETEKQMVSVERAVQYVEDVQPETSLLSTVSINNKWLVFTSSNLFLPWPGAQQDMTRVKTLLIVLRSGRFSRFAHNCFRYLIFFSATMYLSFVLLYFDFWAILVHGSSTTQPILSMWILIYSFDTYYVWAACVDTRYFYGGIVSSVHVRFYFSLPLIFTLLAASISHCLTAALNFHVFLPTKFVSFVFNHSL